MECFFWKQPPISNICLLKIFQYLINLHLNKNWAFQTICQIWPVDLKANVQSLVLILYEVVLMNQIKSSSRSNYSKIRPSKHSKHREIKTKLIGSIVLITLSAWILPNDNKQTIGSNAIFSLLAFHSSIIVSKMFTERRGAGGGGGGGSGQ